MGATAATPSIPVSPRCQGGYDDMFSPMGWDRTTPSDEAPGFSGIQIALFIGMMPWPVWLKCKRLRNDAHV
jgi:hypothetical protein